MKDKCSNMGRHFDLCGKENMRIQIIEQCATKDDMKEREGYWMKKLSTLSPNGLNVECARRKEWFRRYCQEEQI